MGKSYSYIQNLSGSIILKVINIIMSFTVSIVLARSLGAMGRGQFSYFLTITTIIGYYGILGVDYSILYFAKKKEIPVGDLYSTNIIFSILITVIIAILLLVLKQTSNILDEVTPFICLMAVVLIGMTFFVKILSQGYLNYGHVLKRNLIYSSALIIRLIGLVVLMIIGKLNVETAIVAQTLFKALEFILILINNPIKLNRQFQATFLLKQLKYSSWILIGHITIYLNLRIDQLFIKQLMSFRDLGVYSVSASLAEISMSIPIAMASTYLGKIFSLGSDYERINTVTSRTIRLSNLIFFLLLIPGIPACFLIPWVYGDEYRNAIPLVMTLFASILFIIPDYFLKELLVLEGKKIAIALTGLAALAINIILNLLLIPIMGLFGAAIATTFSYFSLMIIRGFFIQKKMGLRISDYMFFRFADVRKVFDTITKRMSSLHQD